MAKHAKDPFEAHYYRRRQAELNRQRIAELERENGGLRTMAKFMAERMVDTGYSASCPASFQYIVRNLRSLGVDV